MLTSILARLLVPLVLLFSTSVYAHTSLQGSSPTDGEQVSQPPAELQLHFSGKVRLMRVSLEEAERGKIKLAFMPGAVPEKDISLQLPVLDAGNYKVSWIAMGGDGHKMSGEFTFGINTEK